MPFYQDLSCQARNKPFDATITQTIKNYYIHIPMERCLIYDIRHIWLQIARLRESSPAINKKKKNKKGRKTSIIFHEINYFPLCLPCIKTISSIFWNTLKILFINSIRFNFYIKKKKSEIGSNLFFLKRERKKNNKNTLSQNY